MSSLHDKLVAAAADMARGLSVGAGIDRADFGANMGAMIFPTPVGTGGGNV